MAGATWPPWWSWLSSAPHKSSTTGPRLQGGGGTDDDGDDGGDGDGDGDDQGDGEGGVQASEVPLACSAYSGAPVVVASPSCTEALVVEECGVSASSARWVWCGMVYFGLLWFGKTFNNMIYFHLSCFLCFGVIKYGMVWYRSARSPPGTPPPCPPTCCWPTPPSGPRRTGLPLHRPVCRLANCLHFAGYLCYLTFTVCLLLVVCLV